MSSERLEFGPFVLEPEERRLSRDGALLQLTPKAFDALVLLVARRGHLLERKEMMDALWPGIYVDDGNLSDNVSKLRQTLGDDPREPRYIATVAGRGYRFVGTVRESGPAGEGVQSIAILPFRVLGGSDADAHLGLGLADALITTLSNVRSLVVRPTSAIFGYSDRALSSVEAGREQNVDAVVEGTVQRSTDRIRVTVKLLRTADGAASWGAKFDEKLVDIFEVQDSISERVATELVKRLSADERALLRKHYTENLEAYELYLQGRFHWNKFTPEELDLAVTCFQRAIATDERYALAYAGLSVTYAVQGAFGMVAPSEAMLKAKNVAERAVAIDERLPEAHLALAAARLLLDWDWPSAEEEALRAQELNPNYADAHTVLGYQRAITGRHDEALAFMRTAARLQPNSAVQRMDLGQAYYWSRDYERAVAMYYEGHTLDPMHVPVPFFIAQAYERNGVPQLAIEECEKVLRLMPDHPAVLAGLAVALGSSGDEEAAKRTVDTLRELSQRQYVSSFLMALAYVGANDDRAAIVALSRAYVERDPQLAWVAAEPQLERLHATNEFRSLVQKMRLS